MESTARSPNKWIKRSTILILIIFIGPNETFFHILRQILDKLSTRKPERLSKLCIKNLKFLETSRCTSDRCALGSPVKRGPGFRFCLAIEGFLRVLQFLASCLECEIISRWKHLPTKLTNQHCALTTGRHASRSKS